MKLHLRDSTGHTTIEVTEKEEFDKIMTEGYGKVAVGAKVKMKDQKKGEESYLYKTDLTWDKLKEAEEVTFTPPLAGGC